MERGLFRFQLAIVIGLACLALRLVHLQLVNGAHYRQLAEHNRVRLVPERPPRGIVLDRRGRVLAINREVFSVVVIPQEVTDLEAIFEHVSELTGSPVKSLARAWRKGLSLPFLPATIVSQVPRERALRIEESRWRYPGMMIKAEAIRRYPYGITACHVLGYLSKPTAEGLPKLKRYGVQPTQLVGRTGLERMLDHILRGKPGGVSIEVDNRARQVRILGRKKATRGQSVVITLDAELQQLIERLFGAQPGAGVVLDPYTGEVLAMVSVPGFRPEVFANSDSETIQKYLNDKRAPLMNRATEGLYQPGSIVKLAVAAAGLEYGVIDPETKLVCAGSLRIGDRTIHCWNRDGHGALRLREAIMQSCNVYFMRLGMRLGELNLRMGLRQAGFGMRTGWPMQEQVGLIAPGHLTGGEVAMLALGQGEIVVTCMQVAVVAASFANGGWLVEPWFVKQIGNGSVSRRPVHRRAGWSAKTLEIVRGGMQDVVRDPRGTGYMAYTPAVSIAGKTGTAQTNIEGKPNGWFTGFCPVDHPQIALAIVAEHGGSGGELPAYIARKVCEYVASSHSYTDMQQATKSSF